MNDLQIDYFLAVARNLNFTKTAEELYVTQPAVSRQISFLEKELDVTLFDRTNKTTILTEAGSLYFEYFEKYREELKQIKSKLKEYNQGVNGKIRLGCMEGWDLSGFFPKVIDGFLKDYPNVKLELECYSIKNLAQALKNESIDVALSIDITLKDIENLEFKEITEIQKIILFSKRHRLSINCELTPKDFKDETFFVLSNDEASYAGEIVIDDMKRLYGFKPKLQYVHNIDSMNACVHNGMGVAILDSWSSAKQMEDLRYIPIESKHKIILAWKNKKASDLVHVFSNEIKFIHEKQKK